MPYQSHRITIRSIAAKAGVSTMTVSLALRRHPKIPVATRERVLRIANKLGYRPDPELAKLMNRLRRARQPHFKSTIAGLTSVAERDEHPYHRELIAGARRRADELGYRLEIFRFAHGNARDSVLQRTLRSRGVEGVLLLPVHDPGSLAPLLDWSHFSVIAATSGVLNPEFHRVVPHHFGNTLLLCHNLMRLGYRRLGLVVDRDFDVHVTPGFSAAVLWQHAIGATQAVTPLLQDTQQPTDVPAWFKREQPDAIIVRGVADAAALVRDLELKFPGPVGVAVSNVEGSRSFAGIDGNAGEIGAAAIEQLNSKIVTGERGIPSTPMLSMIQGRWIPGPSVRRKVVRADASSKAAKDLT